MYDREHSGSISLLSAFLFGMTLVVVLFAVLVVGVSAYTGNVVEREKKLISTFLPELDVAFQLAAGTASLQSQGLLLSKSVKHNELSVLRDQLDISINQVNHSIRALNFTDSKAAASLEQDVKSIAQVAIRLVKSKQQQLSLVELIHEEKLHLLDLLGSLQRDVQQEIVHLTEALLESSQSLNEAATVTMSINSASERAGSSTPLLQRIDSYDILNDAIQDYLLMAQDITSLKSTIGKVPLLTFEQSIDVAAHERDLLLTALVSRSIYINDGEHARMLLPSLRSLRDRMLANHGIFAMQKDVSTHDVEQKLLGERLRGQTVRILNLTDELRNETQSTVSTMAMQTLHSIERYRTGLLLLSILVMLLLGVMAYWLLYRKTVVPLMHLTQQLDEVGTERFTTSTRSYFLKELSCLSSAVIQLDEAQKSMNEKDIQLRLTNRNLSRAYEELEQFAHIASHDLQEPLRKMQQFSDLLEEDYEELLDEEGKFFLSAIRSAAQRMSMLIKETLAYSRAGSANQIMENVNLSLLLDTLLDEIALAVDEAAADFRVSALPVVHANALGMASLFRNLMTNAIKYSKPDTPPIVSVSVETVRSGSTDALCILVKDNGIGIEEKYLQRVFNPFERLKTNDAGGTGLGLAICKKVCDSHDWELDISSQVGVGTVFRIVIPVANVVSYSANTSG